MDQDKAIQAKHTTFQVNKPKTKSAFKGMNQDRDLLNLSYRFICSILAQKAIKVSEQSPKILWQR